MQVRHHRAFSREHWILLVLFVLAGMNFQAKFFYFVFAALLVHIVTNRKIRVEQSIVWYVLFTCVYALYALDYGIMDAIRKLAFISCYVLGFNTVLNLYGRRSSDLINQEKWLKYCIVAFSAGAWIHLMLNFYINSGSSGIRNTIDIWTGKSMAATGQAALGILMLATGTVLFLLGRKKSVRIFGVISFLSILLYNFMLAGRTLVFLSLIIVAACFGFVIVSRQISTREKLNIALLLAVVLIGIVLFLAFDIAGVQKELMKSNLIERIIEFESGEELIADGRMNRKTLYLQHMFEYPFGGLHLRKQYGHAHDLLLDAYDECGLFMLIALIAILWNALKDGIKLLKLRNINYQTKGLVLCVYLAIMIEFCLEPIFAGMPWLFAGFALFSGCIRGVVYANK